MTPKETAIEILKDCEYIQELDYAVKNTNAKIEAIEQVNAVFSKLESVNVKNKIELMEFWQNVLYEIVHYDL